MSDLPVPVTAFYSGLLGAFFVGLSARVSYYRMATHTTLGDGTLEIVKAADEKAAREKYAPLQKAIRAQANLSEYTPIFLVLLGWLELNGYPKRGIHTFGIVYLLSRLAHAHGMGAKYALGIGRRIGIASTYLSVLGVSLANIFKAYQKGKLF